MFMVCLKIMLLTSLEQFGDPNIKKVVSLIIMVEKHFNFFRTLFLPSSGIKNLVRMNFLIVVFETNVLCYLCLILPTYIASAFL